MCVDVGAFDITNLERRINVRRRRSQNFARQLIRKLIAEILPYRASLASGFNVSGLRDVDASHVTDFHEF